MGPELSQTVLDFGSTRGKVAQAEAAYDADVAGYHQSVLTAMQEVEDYLDVASTENTSLTQQQSVLSLVSTQMVTSVKLIAALGGGWNGDVGK